MSEARVPEELLRFVASDLHPVRPLWTPGRRALAFAPMGLLLLVGVPGFWGWRHNLSALSPSLAWGVSAVQAFAGLVIVALGLRESVPGRDLSRVTLAAIAAGAGTLIVAVTLLTDALVPTAVPAGADWRYAWECFGMIAGPGVIALAVAAWLALRALPVRPAVAGSLCGLGAGLMADAGARLFCWVSTPGHVLLAHGSAIVGLTLLGAAAATVAERLPKRSG